MKKSLKIFALISALNVFLLDICLNKAYAIDDVYENYDPNASKVACGTITGIPKILPQSISIIYTIILIAVPVLLVILGTIDLFKGIAAQKEDDIKKAQGMFIKRLISALLVFFVMVIVKFAISLVSNNTQNIFNCLDCFISNDCGTYGDVDVNGNWDCTIKTKSSAGRYSMMTYTFKANGTISIDSHYKTEINSEFVPTNSGECPKENEYEAVETAATIEGQYGYIYNIVKK